MVCYYPNIAVRVPGQTKLKILGRKTDNAQQWCSSRYDEEMITLPCGQCIGCRLEYSRQWAIRCMHEASMYDDNCFITLTYDNDHLPSDGSLHKSHFQN